MTFPEKLQALRKAKGWSQEELAAQIPISRQAVSKWESGAAAPDTENVVALADLFGVSTDYLLRDNCESDGDTPAVQRMADEARQTQSRAVGWIGCVGMQYVGFLTIVASMWGFQTPPYAFVGVMVQIAGITVVEMILHFYSRLPGTRDARRRFYRISVWAFSWFPCQAVTAFVFHWKTSPFQSLLPFLCSQALYLLVSGTVTWLLRPKKE
ncbi:MAG: helix-turn-helix transcriptional regulator [Oscillibacter sp.]|nr:helix-turn-helix transcriptional regulator [Oscillibacter sp.]